MRSYFKFAIKHRRVIMATFVVAAILCAWMKGFVSVNYDIHDYLPKDSPSTVSLNFMKDEFGSAMPNTRVMISNVTRKEAEEYKRKLAEIDGVMSVMWVDDAIPVEVPLNMYPEDTLETYYKDGNALFLVSIDKEKQISAVPKIYDLIDEDDALTGASVNTVVATLNTVSEVRLITIVSVICLFFILVLTMTSWVEPIVVLLGLGIAIVINAGTNLMFGEISFVTNSSGNILQLAVSLDYSVFLIHRFDECRLNKPAEEAMEEALTLSASSIAASGLTTIIGFMALVLMRFRIGPDLGFALAKGVAISLITAFTFMPGLILSTYKLMDKTRHKPFLPPFRKFGGFVCKITKPLAVIFALIILPSFYCSTHNSYYYGAAHIFGTDTRLGADTARIEEVFGENDTYVLMVPRGDDKEEYALVRELLDMDEVSSVTSVVGLLGPSVPVSVLPDTLVDQLRSDEYDRIVVSASVPDDGENAYALIDRVKETAQAHYPDAYYLAGQGVSTYDLKKTVTADMVKINLIAAGAIFLILLLTMKNLILPLILVLTIETAIWFNLSISYVLGTPLYYIAYLIISSIQLGATVDYAILFTERYKENRAVIKTDKFGGDHGKTSRACVIETISGTAVSILVSATAMTIMGFLMGAVSTHRLIAQLGMLLGRGTLCSLFAVLFILPGLLMAFDRFFSKERGDTITPGHVGSHSEAI